jgi:hypothetical protein
LTRQKPTKMKLARTTAIGAAAPEGEWGSASLKQGVLQKAATGRQRWRTLTRVGPWLCLCPAQHHGLSISSCSSWRWDSHLPGSPNPRDWPGRGSLLLIWRPERPARIFLLELVRRRDRCSGLVLPTSFLAFPGRSIHLDKPRSLTQCPIGQKGCIENSWAQPTRGSPPDLCMIPRGGP